MEIKSVEKKERSELHRGHRIRLRYRGRRDGIDSLSEHQFLEYALSFVIPRKDTNDLAHKLINKFGSLMNVLTAPYDVLVKFNGLGDASATFLCTFLDMFNYVSNRAFEGANKVTSTFDAIKVLKPLFAKVGKEKFILLLIDGADNLIHYEISKVGKEDTILVNMDEMRETVKAFNAKKAVIAHNHPTGLAMPSKSDIKFTKTIFSMFHFLGVELVDHCILTMDGEHFSFRSNNLIEKYKEEMKEYYDEVNVKFSDYLQ